MRTHQNDVISFLCDTVRTFFDFFYFHMPFSQMSATVHWRADGPSSQRNSLLGHVSDPCAPRRSCFLRLLPLAQVSSAALSYPTHPNSTPYARQIFETMDSDYFNFHSEGSKPTTVQDYGAVDTEVFLIQENSASGR